MTKLREKMREDLRLRGLSEATQRAYLLAVKGLAAYYQKSPDLLTEAEIRRYLLYLQTEKQVANKTFMVYLCGIKFFYEQTLGREWQIFDLVHGQREQKLPVVLSVAEVQQLLACVRRPRYRVCLSTIYACGLRVSEGVRLRVEDIDSPRMLLWVRQGKGRKDRSVPLPERTLELLRDYSISTSTSALDLSHCAGQTTTLTSGPETYFAPNCQKGFSGCSARKRCPESRHGAHIKT